ncbi:MAG: hypothetical protein J0H98_03420 [Solirubrobacterales bacterium]|nr:hypothetical protein [Solirubrobacterales bacterium]
MTGAAASAAQATEVSVRVEGASSTLLETEVDTTVHRVDGGDGSGAHDCRGPIGEAAGPTVTGALDDALRAAGKTWKGQWSSSSGDFLIDRVAGESATNVGPWTILLNGVPTPVGGCSMKVVDGDRILFARDVVFQTKTLRLTGPDRVEPGQALVLTVEDERDGGAPVSGAEIATTGRAETTGGDGRATFTLEEPGRHVFKATHPDGIRSNSLEVCVGVSGCDGNEGPPARILKFADDSRFMRGAAPRVLRGRSRGSSVRVVIRNGRGRVLAREIAVTDGLWETRIGTLRPGRYRLLAWAIGIPGQTWRTGVNRIGLSVSGRRLTRARMVGRAIRFLDRRAGSGEVRGSGLLAAWSGLALGVRDRGSAGRVLRALTRPNPRRSSDGELARDLAAIMRIRKGRSRVPGLARRLPAMRRELAGRQAEDGSFGQDVNLTAMSILALPNSYAATRAAAWLGEVQGSDGGFGISPGGSPDIDTTGLAAWALASQGYREEVASAAAFVRSGQNPDGGFPAVAGGASNAQSTGLGLLAIHLAGGSRLGPKTEDGISPTHYLATLQRRAGSIDYTPGLRTTPVWVTSQAVLGLTARSLLVSG